MGNKILIHPVNRMEGHLTIDAQTAVAESGGVRVTDASLKGELYRGFEQILMNRDPRDPMVLCQRI